MADISLARELINSHARLPAPRGHERRMRIGIGLPAAVPGTPATAIADAAGERQGFESLAVLDRLVYDNLDPHRRPGGRRGADRAASS